MNSTRLKIVLTGGGTGGHITPILALARELKRLNPDIYLVYIGERAAKFGEMTSDNPDIDEVRTIFAGKFRRYHGESWLSRLLDVKTILLNLRDLFYFGLGTLQALVLMKRLNPDTVFLKGGFVGVPAGLAAAFWKIPFVTHDSDAIPGLANRLVSRWSRYHATALPAENYSYPKESIKHVGVLISEKHGPVSAAQQKSFKQAVGVPADSRLLLVMGGSSGAAAINRAVRNILPRLFEDYKDLYVIHQVGKGKRGVYEGYAHHRLRVEELLFPMYEYTGASDVVVTRAGANALAELGAQGRACIVVPNPQLTGGHQMENAEILKEQGAAKIVKETTKGQEIDGLDAAIRKLLGDKQAREKLGERFQSVTVTDAAAKLARLLLQTARK